MCYEDDDEPDPADWWKGDDPLDDMLEAAGFIIDDKPATRAELVSGLRMLQESVSKLLLAWPSDGNPDATIPQYIIEELEDAADLARWLLDNDAE